MLRLVTMSQSTSRGARLTAAGVSPGFEEVPAASRRQPDGSGGWVFGATVERERARQLQVAGDSQRDDVWPAALFEQQIGADRTNAGTWRSIVAEQNCSTRARSTNVVATAPARVPPIAFA